MSPAGMRNNEGYFDPTAGYALRNIERTEKPMQEFRRGDIFYVEKFGGQVGSEQYSGRPALIVSNNKCNVHSEVVEVVYLTTSPKSDLPTHVTIRSTTRESTAICEQVTSVAKERFQNFIASASASEMAQIDMALLISLDLTMGAPEASEAHKKTIEAPVLPVPPEPKPESAGPNYEVAYRMECAEKEKIKAELEKRLIKSEAELAVYKGLFTEMTDRAMGRTADA